MKSDVRTPAPTRRRWARRLPELATFVDTRGRMPSISAGDLAERRLARWWGRRREVQVDEQEKQALAEWSATSMVPCKWMNMYEQVTKMAADPSSVRAARAGDLRRWLQRQHTAELSTRQRELVAGLVLPDRPRKKHRPPRWKISPAKREQMVAQHRERMAKANTHRTATAAHRTVAQARIALHIPDLAARYGTELRARIAHPADDLATLATKAGVSKHVFAGRLRRALQNIPDQGLVE